jgi:hypothetical protein
LSNCFLRAYVGITRWESQRFFCSFHLLLLAILLRWKHNLVGRLGPVLLGGVLLGLTGLEPQLFVFMIQCFSPLIVDRFWMGNNPIATGYPKFPPGLHAGQKQCSNSITTAERRRGVRSSVQVSAYWAQQGRGWIAVILDWLKLVG